MVFVVILFSLILFTVVLPVFAANPTVSTLEDVGTGAGYAQQANPENTFSTLIGQVVQAFLSLLGIIFLVLMLYGGYTWMTSAGDEAKVSKSKETIKNAIIGIVITAGAYGIWAFVARFIL